ncbi:MAG: flavin reductase family protein [Proteobacteria bacterium]|nr:flavin reductase family protein [Pseudomonadota bacterium]
MKKSFGSKTLIHPTPVWCVGSYDKENKPNVMTAAWGGICCSRPACVSVSLRKATYTYGNIVERRAYTISVPSEQYVAQADYFGIVSGKKVDKFAVSGLTPVKAEFVDAPYIKEFPMVLECKVVNIFELGLHTQFIGEIMDVKAEETALDDNGLPDMGKIRPVVYGPENRLYYGIGSNIGQAFAVGRKLAGIR